MTTPTSNQSKAEGGNHSKAEGSSVLDRVEATLLLLRPLWVLVFVVLLVVYGWRAATHPDQGDTRFYGVGAERFLSGQNLYFDLPYEGRDRPNSGYTYPPPFAVVSVWMRVLPYPAARILWLFAMATCMLGSLWLTWRLISLRERPKRPDIAMLVACLVVARFALNDLAHGQVNWLISFLLLLALLRAEEERPWHAGLFLGLALVIKPTAWLLLPFYALARRDPKLIAACASTGLLLILLPVLRYGPSAYTEVCADWLRLMEAFSRHSAESPDNMSLVSALTRRGVGAARWITLAFVGSAFGLLCWRRGRSAVAPAVVLVLGALLSPVTWKAHLVLLLLPAAWLGKRLSDRPTKGGWIGLGALLLLLLLPSHGLLNLRSLDNGGVTLGIALLGLLAVWSEAPAEASRPQDAMEER